MGTSNHSDEFKRDAVHHITVRGVSGSEGCPAFGRSAYFLYKWLTLYGEQASKQSGVDHEAENRRLKRELARVTEVRAILEKTTAYFECESQ